MPFASEKQRRYMHSQHPGIAERWDEEERLRPRTRDEVFDTAPYRRGSKRAYRLEEEARRGDKLRGGKQHKGAVVRYDKLKPHEEDMEHYVAAYHGRRHDPAKAGRGKARSQEWTRAQLGKRADVGKGLFRHDPGDHSRQGAHGTNRGWADDARTGYQMVGGGLAVVGAANMPGAGQFLAHGENAATSRRGKAAWRAAERARTRGVIPAGNAVGRQMVKLKPVGDLASNVPRKIRPLLFLSAGTSMMRGDVPRPVEALNPMGWT